MLNVIVSGLAIGMLFAAVALVYNVMWPVVTDSTLEVEYITL